MINKPKLSIILPSYLEEENLRILLPRLNKVLGDLGILYEILVIDTMEALDNTKDACEQNKAIYINRTNGNSFGNAVRCGIKFANGEYILFMDADGSHPPEFIPFLFKYVDSYDIVVASRYIEGGYTENSKILVLMSKAVNIIYSLVLGIRCKDVSNSFKIYKASLLKKLDFRCDNFDIVEEILFKVIKSNKNLRIKEVPFSFKQRMFGKTKRNLLAFMTSYLFTLIKLRFGR